MVSNPAFEVGHAAGHRARRLIKGADPAFSDPFLLMAEDWTPRDAFSVHPHRGFETVTIVLEGAIEHFDSAGNTGVIYAGDAQWMTAGRGVMHNENPAPGTTAHTLQLWVNLPASAGRPLREPVVFGGPFVMNTREQIDEAFAEFRAGRFLNT